MADPTLSNPDERYPLDTNENVELSTVLWFLARGRDRVWASTQAGLTSEFFPSSGRVGLVTATDTLYIADGSQWLAVETDTGLSAAVLEATDTFIDAQGDQVSDLSATTVASAFQPPNGTDDNIALQPPADALREGYIVANSATYQQVEDPRDYPSAAVAMQTANDALRDSFGGTITAGKVWFPPTDPDGNQLTIDQTVTFGDPTDQLGAGITSNWYFQAVEGGATQGTVDMGVAPSDSPIGEYQVFALNFITTGSAGSGDQYRASIELDSGNGEAVVSSANRSLNQFTWRWYVEQTGSAGKSWDLEPQDGHRLYRA